MYVDMHAHLDYDCYENISELVKKLREKNILVYSNTTSLSSYNRAVELFKNDTDVIKIIPGFYPVNVENSNEKEIEEFFNFLEMNKKEYDAIGEVGLDMKEGNNLEKQIFFLKKVLEFAIRNDKAVILHTRKAEGETLKLLKEYVYKYNYNKFCLHCFTGKKKYYKDILELGIYCSIPYMVVKLQQFQELVKFMPANKLLAETDSPFLHPYREINTPLNIPKIYEVIADLKGLNKEEIKNIIYNNYLNLIK